MRKPGPNSQSYIQRKACTLRLFFAWRRCYSLLQTLGMFVTPSTLYETHMLTVLDAS